VTRRTFALLGACLGALGSAVAASAAAPPEPSPYRVLPTRVIETPALDATPACAPSGAGPPAAVAASRLGALPGEARAGLEALAADPDPGLRACAQLELARLDLAERRLPDASLRVARAERVFAPRPLPPALREAADFQRAEALLRGGRAAEAAPLYAALLEAEQAGLGGAAALLLAELRAEASGSAEDHAAFAARLAGGTGFGATPAAWAPRAAELAIAAGDLDAARDWLAKADAAELDATSAGLVAVRRADVRLALGDAEPAAAALRKIAARHEEPRVRALAGVRLLHTGLARADDASLRRLLERAADGSDPNLASYARGVLVGRLRTEGEIAAALDLLVRLATDARAPQLAPDLPAQFAATLAAAVAPEVDCAGVVERLGGRRGLLLRLAPSAEPFLRLGDCYLELGFAKPALAAYRAVTRRFGVEIAATVSLRAAEAAFAAGQRDAARAPAAANLARAGEGREVEDLGAWMLLLARIELADGTASRTVALLEQALREDLVVPAQQAAALRLLAVAALREPLDAGRAAAVRTTLRRELAQLPEAEPPEQARLRHEALLHAADLHLAAGERRQAGELYRRAGAVLEQGPFAARSWYWGGALAARGDLAHDSWQRAVSVEAGGLWARLAADEIAVGALRQAIGRDRRRSPPPGARP